MLESKKRQTVIQQYDNKLNMHIKAIQQNNEEISNEMRNNIRSDIKKKSQAVYRTSGEQAGNILFRKSVFIRDKINQKSINSSNQSINLNDN